MGPAAPGATQRKEEKKPATPKKIEVAGLIFLLGLLQRFRTVAEPLTPYWAVVNATFPGLADPPLALKPQMKTL
jgi:hypothetical protein